MNPSTKKRLERQKVHRSIYNRAGKNKTISRLIWGWHFIAHKNLLLSASGKTMLQWNGESWGLDKSCWKDKALNWLMGILVFRIFPWPMRWILKGLEKDFHEQQRLNRLKLLTKGR